MQLCSCAAAGAAPGAVTAAVAVVAAAVAVATVAAVPEAAAVLVAHESWSAAPCPALRLATRDFLAQPAGGPLAQSG